ncbi:sigma-70 family RNA polymerase sigma factor [Arthrobacter sp. KBS0703]|jgi:RNA polymerase sigma-70 factor (ECF subfamily)|uniref:sigma-70 family RNA polymerase sigma factor n=1 Tax=Bacteria TaxID=2 RepID=UPI00098FC699|nr:sigma-70 family RNA polymerase sigma factor [Arthrobacter sp. KBS0703]TSE14476.1 sigma-70 family RNA polymerase sigma factor [Arthrobacter sp. KBS0703]
MADQQDEMLRLLHETYAPALWRFVSGLTRDHAAAEDIVQETLIRLWKHPAVLQRPEPAVRSWLFTVARHLVIDDRRSARKQHEVPGDSLPETAAADQTDRILDTWLIGDALAGLSPEHRDVIMHAYYHGETTSEIAQKLHVAEGTVKSRLHYALRAMRLALQERGVTL